MIGGGRAKERKEPVALKRGGLLVGGGLGDVVRTIYIIKEFAVLKGTVSLGTKKIRGSAERPISSFAVGQTVHDRLHV